MRYRVTFALFIVRLLLDWLKRQGHDVRTLRDPTGMTAQFFVRKP